MPVTKLWTEVGEETVVMCFTVLGLARTSGFLPQR